MSFTLMLILGATVQIAVSLAFIWWLENRCTWGWTAEDAFEEVRKKLDIMAPTFKKIHELEKKHSNDKLT